MSIIKMRGPIDVLFAFKIFSLPVLVPELFGKYPTRPVPKSKTPTRQTLIMYLLKYKHEEVLASDDKSLKMNDATLILK